jgi:hypothetical protein
MGSVHFKVLTQLRHSSRCEISPTPGLHPSSAVPKTRSTSHHENTSMARRQDRQNHQALSTQVSITRVVVPSARIFRYDAQRTEDTPPIILSTQAKGAHISPIGVVPQHDCHPCTIFDYSFCDVNDYTAHVAPNELMQFGRALHDILCLILESNPQFGPVYMCKIDIADKFYRVWLLPADIPKLGVVFPTKDDGEPLTGPPLVIPMGWVNYPPYVTSTTETICDLANASLKQQTSSFPHQLDTISEMAIPDDPAFPTNVAAPLHYNALTEASNIQVADQAQQPVATHDVYVHDFVSMVHGNSKWRRQVK